MPLPFMHDNYTLFLLGYERDYWALWFYSIIVYHRMLITEINEYESVESKISMIDESLLMRSQKFVPLYQLFCLVIICKNGEIDLPQEYFRDFIIPNSYFHLRIQVWEMSLSRLGSGNLILYVILCDVKLDPRSDSWHISGSKRITSATPWEN